MNHLSDYHHYLLAGKIAGNLNEDEAVELEQLFRDHAGMRLAYQQMLSELPGNMIDEQFRFIDNPEFWKKPAQLRYGKDSVKPLTPKNRTIPLIVKVVAAAVLTGLVAGIWYWYPFPSSGERPAETVAAAPLPDQGIRLTLANGKTVDLSRQQGNITEGAATLVNESKSLHYSVNGEVAVGINSVFVPVGMDYQITLSDGSKVWMNSMTRLDFPFRFNAGKREITLEGEAYIEVAKDASRPFTVHLPNSSVKVLGTEFNVNTYDSGVVKVALVEGSVNLTGGGLEATLAPGNQAVYTGGGSIEQAVFHARSVLSWRKGVVYFEYADLQEIARVLQRWYGVTVRIDNAALNQKRIKGVLNKDQPLSVFLDDLKFIANINSQLDKDGVLRLR